MKTAIAGELTHREIQNITLTLNLFSLSGFRIKNTDIEITARVRMAEHISICMYQPDLLLTEKHEAMPETTAITERTVPAVLILISSFHTALAITDTTAGTSADNVKKRCPLNGICSAERNTIVIPP